MRRILLVLYAISLSIAPFAAQERDHETNAWRAVAMSPTSGDVVIITGNGLEKAFVIDAYNTPTGGWDWSNEATISPNGRFIAFKHNSFIPSEQVDPNPILIANLDDESCCIELALPEGALPNTTIEAFSDDSTQLRVSIQVAATDNGNETTRAESLTYDLTTSPPEIVLDSEFIPFIEDDADTLGILGSEEVGIGIHFGAPIEALTGERGRGLSGRGGNVVIYSEGDSTPIVLFSRDDAAHSQAVWGMNGEAVLATYDDFPVRPNFVTILFRDGTTLDAEFDVQDIRVLHGTPDGWILLLDRLDRETRNNAKIAHLSLVDGEAQLQILAQDLPLDMFLIQKPILNYDGDATFVPIGDGEAYSPY